MPIRESVDSLCRDDADCHTKSGPGEKRTGGSGFGD